MENHVLLKIGNIPVEDIDQHMIKKTLEPLWHSKVEAARKSLASYRSTLKYAAALGLEVDLQATRKAGALLGKQRHKTEHIQAMPFADAPKFYRWFCGQKHTAALALRILILTAARTSEVRLATIDEIEDGIWTLTPERTKTGHEHRAARQANLRNGYVNLHEEGGIRNQTARFQNHVSHLGRREDRCRL